MGTNHKGVSGYIPLCGPITGESAGIYPYGDQSQGSQRVYPPEKPTRRVRGAKCREQPYH
eukprot:1184693-Prorocentrum_minimum.AAC.2